MAEHGLRSCIGVIMDGTGYGSDGSVWGGEFLYCEGADFTRLGCLSPVNMCGGDAVSRNADLAALFYKLDAGAVRQEDIPEELRPAAAALRAGIGVYQSSSMGRLFDAAAAILDIAHRNGYEGECAAELENAADRGRGCAEATDCAGTLQGDIARMLRYFRNLTDVSADGMRMIRGTFHRGSRVLFPSGSGIRFRGSGGFLIPYHGREKDRAGRRHFYEQNSHEGADPDAVGEGPFRVQERTGARKRWRYRARAGVSRRNPAVPAGWCGNMR